MGRSVEGLSSEERIAYYRAMSAEALHLARSTNHLTQKAGFLDNAAHWLALAHEVEHVAERLGQFPSADRTPARRAQKRPH